VSWQWPKVGRLRHCPHSYSNHPARTQFSFPGPRCEISASDGGGIRWPLPRGAGITAGTALLNRASIGDPRTADRHDLLWDQPSRHALAERKTCGCARHRPDGGGGRCAAGAQVTPPRRRPTRSRLVARPRAQAELRGSGCTHLGRPGHVRKSLATVSDRHRSHSGQCRAHSDPWRPRRRRASSRAGPLLHYVIAGREATTQSATSRARRNAAPDRPQPGLQTDTEDAHATADLDSDPPGA
jgi:hypothetical protein